MNKISKPLSADWAAMIPLDVDRRGEVTVFRQLFNQLTGAILAGAAPPGGRLPSTRALAARLGIARTVIVSVYEQLLAEGYAEGRPGAGTFVAPQLRPPAAAAPPPSPSTRPTSVARYAALKPDPLQFQPAPFNTGRCSLDPQTLATWRRLTAAQLRRPDPAWLGYSDPCGSPRLRDAVARYLRAARGVQCDPAQIMILTGTQQAMDLIIKILIEPDDSVWIEDPAYPAMHAALRAAQTPVGGPVIVPVPVDAQGMVVQAGIAAAPHARAAYVTPSHQSPSGVVLSMPRRLELLAWARDARAWIIEDDYDSEFRYAGRPLASLQGMDRGERVIYLGTFSKVLFPGLRLGYAVIPYELLDAMAAARHLTDRHPPGLTEAVFTDFIEQGHFATHLRRMCACYGAARDTLVTALRTQAGAHLAVEPPDQGMHLTARLRQGLDDEPVAQAGQAAGIVLRPLSRFYIAAPPVPGLMLGFTGYDAATLTAAAGRLAAVLSRMKGHA